MANTTSTQKQDKAGKPSTTRQTKRVESAVKATTKKSAIDYKAKLENMVKSGEITDHVRVAVERFMTSGFSYTEAMSMVRNLAITYKTKDGKKTVKFVLNFRLIAGHEAIEIKNINPINGVSLFIAPLANGKCFTKTRTISDKESASNLHKDAYIEATEGIDTVNFDKLRAVDYADLKGLVYLAYYAHSKHVSVYDTADTPTLKNVANAMDATIAKANTFSKALAKKSA